FNGDGLPDLAVADRFDNDIAILISTGKGTFQNREITYSIGNEPSDLTTGDFDHDGKLDLAVVDSQNLTILFGLGSGLFGREQTYVAGASPRSVVAGNFDGDPYLDLAVANADSHN